MGAYYFEQFTVVRVVDVVGLSNSSVGMIVALLVVGMYGRSPMLIPGRWQVIVEG